MSTAPCLDKQAVRSQPLLFRFWDATTQPLPLRVIRAPAGYRQPDKVISSTNGFHRAPQSEPFDFCAHIKRLCADIVARCEIFHHIDVSRLLFVANQARSRRQYGLQARVTPLRFHDGRLRHWRNGQPYQVQRYFVNGREMLYVVSFCLPRFLDQNFEDKFVTLFHELYHISPAFNGDLRRLGGRYGIHSRSKACYDEEMSRLATAYLQNGARPALHGFMSLGFTALRERYGQVLGIMVPRPRIVSVSGQPEQEQL